jgi:hypothetical protein
VADRPTPTAWLTKLQVLERFGVAETMVDTAAANFPWREIRWRANLDTGLREYALEDVQEYLAKRVEFSIGKDKSIVVP